MRFPAPGPTAAAPRKAVSCRAWAGAAAGLLGPTSWAHAALAADGAAAVSTSSPWLLALAVVVAAGGWAWQARQNQSQRAALQQLRMERLALADTLDVWQWRSDAQHRITHWRPPSQAGDDAWQPPAALGQLLWTLFEAEDAAGLQTRLTQHASLPGLTVRVACNAAQHGTGHGPAAPPSPPPAPSLAQKQTQILHAQVPMRVQMQLRAAPLTDAQGQFAGHMGTLRRLDEPAAQGHDADPGADPAPAPGLNGATAPAATLDGPPDKDHESFIYTVSHDLRAPIRVVEGFTRILKEDYGRLLDRVGNDHLDRVLGAAARMNSMIDALLALSQLSTQPLARQPVNLSQLAGFILDDLKRQSPERAVTVHVADGLHTQGDPTLLRLVLENLLGNAWKYTGKCAGAEVWFGTDPDDPTVYMVRDNGAGFDMRFADRLFGVFQRLHSASDFQGTGVGLASVRRIVRRHGGEVWAESEVGRGAVFRFTLAPSAAHKLAERQWRQPAKRA